MIGRVQKKNKTVEDMISKTSCFLDHRCDCCGDDSNSAVSYDARHEHFSAFESVREITGALVVERHTSDFRNLSFFRNLRIIQGRELE